MTQRSPVKQPVNKHRQKTEETRRKLIDAALNVFARDGFEASRLEDIAKEAGHTRGAFYANFSTKEDLFVALLEYQSKAKLDQVLGVLAKESTAEERLQVMRNFYLSLAKDRRWATLMLELKLYALRHPGQRAKLAAAHRRIRESFHIELATRIGPTPMNLEHEKHVKLLLEATWNGLVLEHAYDPKRISAAELNHLLGSMFDLLTSVRPV